MRRAFFSPKAHLIFWAIVVAGVAADLWTKSVVFNALNTVIGPQRYSLIDGFLQLVVLENAGAAWGIAQGQRWLLIGVSVMAFFAVTAVFALSEARQKLFHVAMALFTAGIIGNLYDRVFNDGKVRDFIDVYWRDWHWPAFNIADSMLCVAVVMLIIGTNYKSHPTKTRK